MIKKYVFVCSKVDFQELAVGSYLSLFQVMSCVWQVSLILYLGFELLCGLDHAFLSF